MTRTWFAITSCDLSSTMQSNRKQRDYSIEDKAILCQLTGIGKVGQGTECHTGNETQVGEDERC